MPITRGMITYKIHVRDPQALVWAESLIVTSWLGQPIHKALSLSLYPKIRKPLFYIQTPQVFEYKKVVSEF